MYPPIIVTCIDHTNNQHYIRMLNYWIHKYHQSNTQSKVIVFSDSKTDLSSIDKNIDRIQFDLDHDADYQEIKKAYIRDKKSYYDHNLTISDILRFSKAPKLFKNSIIIDLDAIIENPIVLSPEILSLPFAGCDHGDSYTAEGSPWSSPNFTKRLNIGFIYLNTDISNEFVARVIHNKISRPWFCEDILSDLWHQKFYNRLEPEYNWLMSIYGFNPCAFINHYWLPTKRNFHGKQILQQLVDKYHASIT